MPNVFRQSQKLESPADEALLCGWNMTFGTDLLDSISAKFKVRPLLIIATAGASFTVWAAAAILISIS